MKAEWRGELARMEEASSRIERVGQNQGVRLGHRGPDRGRRASAPAAPPLLAAVHPKVVSERLGHATVGITLDTYSHVLPDLQRDAAEALDRVLPPAFRRSATGG